ncbi:GLUG motif-containing protein [Fulvivirga lutea]|uniref:GLUG domain-containing protein n=1 Tax=Fulvivirga lutea TaxID=2810512 RepID=A0A975A1S9_9BACT|nr:GLUG motif-containing protein [Fulvivirga lutea]QSE98754.1 hypothetical protein JR347_06650 [Fulvivirga lutea]
MKFKYIFFSLALMSAAFMSCSTDDTDEIDPIDTVGGGGNGSEVTGSGTDADPYRLSTAEHLDLFLRNRLSSTYVLNNDIDLSAYISENYPTEGWLPINNFEGNFNGGGFTISGLKIDRPDVDGIGFFGVLGNDNNSTAISIEIRNLTIEVAPSEAVRGSTHVGVLLGYANDGLRVTNTHVRGANTDSRVESTASGSETELGRSGGLIGEADRSIITLSSSAINVTSAANRIGGLVGMVNTTTIDQCYASGNVSGSSIRIGGLIGFAANAGTSISNSYSTGTVSITSSSTDDIGGFIGAANSAISPITNCYSTSNLILDVPSFTPGFSPDNSNSFGYFSGDGDGGSGIFGSNLQTILNGSNADISVDAVSEDSGFTLLNISASTCSDFSAFDLSIWSCVDGSFPTLINNP